MFVSVCFRCFITCLYLSVSDALSHVRICHISGALSHVWGLQLITTIWWDSCDRCRLGCGFLLCGVPRGRGYWCRIRACHVLHDTLHEPLYSDWTFAGGDDGLYVLLDGRDLPSVRHYGVSYSLMTGRGVVQRSLLLLFTDTPRRCPALTAARVYCYTSCYVLFQVYLLWNCHAEVCGEQYL